MAFHSSIFEAAFISGLIGPDHNALSIQIIIFELTLVYLSGICEVVFTVTSKFSIYKVTFVIAAVKIESCFSGLLALRELPYVCLRTLIPAFFSLTMLLIVDPLSFIQ